MSRRDLYHAVKGAFFYLYADLLLLCVTLFCVSFSGSRDPWRFVLLAFLSLNFLLALLAKGKLIWDLIEAKPRRFLGEIAAVEDAGSLRGVQVKYLLESAPSHPRKFAAFPDALPLSHGDITRLLSAPAELWYLPRSGVVVKVILPEPSREPPKHRTKAWYRERARETPPKLSRKPALPFWQDFWFWETVPITAALLLLVLIFLFRRFG